MQNKRNVQKGQHGETIARQLLEAHGVKQVRRIETGWTVIRKGARIVSAFPKERVSADWRGVMPSISMLLRGKSVMAEAKEREDRLIYSDIEKYQHAELTEHQALGGLSFVIWVCPNVAAFLLPYPLLGFVPRSSITLESARASSVRTIPL